MCRLSTPGPWWFGKTKRELALAVLKSPDNVEKVPPISFSILPTKGLLNLQECPKETTFAT